MMIPTINQPTDLIMLLVFSELSFFIIPSPYTTSLLHYNIKIKYPLKKQVFYNIPIKSNRIIQINNIVFNFCFSYAIVIS